MRNFHKDAAEHWRKQAELDEELIRDHEDGLHVHEDGFIAMIRDQLARLWPVIRAHEDRADQET